MRKMSPRPRRVNWTRGGICDPWCPPSPPTAPNFGDVQKVNPDADSLLRVAADLANSPDLLHVPPEIRAPNVVFHPSDQENVQTTEVPSDYQSD